MINATRPQVSRALLVALGFAGAAALGLAFALWAENGAAMFVTLVESGLAWCF